MKYIKIIFSLHNNNMKLMRIKEDASQLALPLGKSLCRAPVNYCVKKSILVDELERCITA
jgi:hypothetical protein